jgi:hypothetical protein
MVDPILWHSLSEQRAYGRFNAGLQFVHTRWLGQNSKQNKLMRQLGDIQTKMRLNVSGDKLEIRQSYIPTLHPHVVQPLAEEGTVSLELTLLPNLTVDLIYFAIPNRALWMK